MKKFFAFFLACVPLAMGLSCVSVDPSQKYPNMVADMGPVSAGTIKAEFDRMFSSRLNTVDVEVIFYPRENAAALEFRYELTRYRQFWDEQARGQFIEALGRYKEDYEARNLLTKYSKSRAIYGRVKGRAEWETFKFTATHRSSPIIELGYRFRGELPFFAILQRSAKEESGPSGDNFESRQINTYFTRAQAEKLAAIFDQSYLMGLLGNTATPESPAPAMDNYREFGD
jgi:hypothetical protein